MRRNRDKPIAFEVQLAETRMITMRVVAGTPAQALRVAHQEWRSIAGRNIAVGWTVSNARLVPGKRRIRPIRLKD